MMIATRNNKLISSINPILNGDSDKHNKNWMKDWMEQADNYKNNAEAVKLIANDVDGFLHYADKIEGKYV